MVERSTNSNVVASAMERVREEDEKDIPEEKMHELPTAHNTADEKPVESVTEVVLPFGDDMKHVEEAFGKDRRTRKGSVKSSAYKISRCLKRMEELHETSPNMSQRTIASQVAIEFSTYPRNCYRWKYEWSRDKQTAIHKSAHAHCAGVVLPEALKAMSLGHVRRADLAEMIHHEFVIRKKKSKKVDFQ